MTWTSEWRTSPAPKRKADISVITRLIFAAYFLEAGLVLLVAPWSGFWFRNVFAQNAIVADLLANPFVRGGVSGIGLLTATAGLAELAGAFSRGRRPDVAEPPSP